MILFSWKENLKNLYFKGGACEEKENSKHGEKKKVCV